MHSLSKKVIMLFVTAVSILIGSCGKTGDSNGHLKAYIDSETRVLNSLSEFPAIMGD